MTHVSIMNITVLCESLVNFKAVTLLSPMNCIHYPIRNANLLGEARSAVTALEEKLKNG